MRSISAKVVSLVVAFLIITQPSSMLAQANRYTLDWRTIDSGDGIRNGDRYSIEGTSGQPDAHSLTGGNYILYGGFWALAGFKPDADPTDLVAHKLEITQAIQDLNNSVRLVAHKRTFVRLHVRSTGGIFRTYAQLRLQSNDKPDIWLSPINVDRGHINVGLYPNRLVLNDAFLFELPNHYTEGLVTLTGEVNPLTPWRFRDPAEQDVSNNRVTTTVSFENLPTVNLVIYGIGYGENQILPGQVHYDHLSSWLRRAYPISLLQVQQRTLFQSVDQPTCDTINATLAAMRVQDLAANRVTAGTHYYGLVDDRGGVMSPSCAAGIPAFAAAGATGVPRHEGYDSAWDTDDSYGDWLGGHELGHAYGRFHAQFCGAGGGSPYPYPNGRISPTLTGDTAIYGFNLDTREIYGPEWSDVMTYCQWNWVSDFTYEGLMDYFQQNPAVASINRSRIAQADRLLITGVFEPQANQVRLLPIFVIANAGDVQERTPGDYTIVLRTAAGAELARYAFTPTPMHERGLHSSPSVESVDSHKLLINEFVPYVSGADRVDLEGPTGLLKTITAGAGVPTVQIITPNNHQAITAEKATIAWAASDPDGDPLTFSVQYSPDDGVSWLTLAHNLTAQTITIDAKEIVGSQQARFRVLVTDGIHTASAQTDSAFSVPNHIPTAEIVTPSTAVTVALSQTVALEGYAYDADIGTMSGNQLRWTSSQDGLLGTGAQLSTASLSQGTHIITLQADDGVGGVAIDTIQVTVVENPSRLPAAADALQVGPTQISLNTATNTISATLSVANQNGLNAIAWSVAANQPWLQLSTTTGTTPAILTVSVNAATTPKGINMATLTFTSPQLSGQKVEVQVEVENGQAGTVLNKKAYLPVVIK